MPTFVYYAVCVITPAAAPAAAEMLPPNAPSIVLVAVAVVVTVTQVEMVVFGVGRRGSAGSICETHPMIWGDLIVILDAYSCQKQMK